MPRLFNVSGPCQPHRHYMLPAMRRLPSVREIIDEGGYFVLHAPRQVGKTTALMTLAQELTAEGHYAAALLSLEMGAAWASQPGKADQAILADWRESAGQQLPADCQPPPWPEAPEGAAIRVALAQWAARSSRPLVLFLDEIDALQDAALVSVLHQLRAGFPSRPKGFPWSLALIGLRDVRDYKVAAGGSSRLGTASPFNIKDESLTLRNFTRDEVAELYQQHTDDTGQVFVPAAVDRAFYLTQGQPWLVNALARQITKVLLRDRGQPITAAHVDAAKEIVIQRRDTHLDSLAERLREERVRHIIEPILASEHLPDVPDDDLRFVQDLGLCRADPQLGLTIANPIYREVIPRVLAQAAQLSIRLPKPTWLDEHGQLLPEKLLEAFLTFWRQHAGALLATAPYHEVAPHLGLMAFLHRVVNGGGTIEREYAIGSGRMDLCLRYGKATLCLELKVWRDGRPDPLHEGLTQLDGYLAGMGVRAGWLVLFDQRSGQSAMAERTRVESAATAQGRQVTVIRG